MDRYNREERDYHRGERGRADPEPRVDPEPSGSLGDFPWQDSGGGDLPAQSWEEPPAQHMGDAVPGSQRASERNPLAVAGFILSLVMWIALIVPYLSLILWILALAFSSIGLRRARRRGAAHKGLAIAGLCISLAGVVIVVLFILFLLGAALVSAA